MINDAFTARALSDSRFVGKRIFGIATTITYLETDGTTVKNPMLTNDYDDEVYVGYDNSYPITIYHKSLTINREMDLSGNIMTETAQMQMIVYGDRKKIKLAPEELDALLVESFPIMLSKTQISPYKLRSVTVTPGQTNFNSTALYIQEYSAESRMKPNDIFFSTNYTVQSSFKQGCLDLCECEPNVIVNN